MDAWVWAVVALGLIFEFVNGFHDAANAIATSVLTRALSIRTAVVLCAIINFVGALSSKAVATTMGKGIVDPTNITSQVVVAALMGAIIWDIITWRVGMPTSSTHAIVGGVIGAAVGSKGWSIVELAGTKKVFLGLVISPIAGILVAFVVMVLFLWIFGHQQAARLNRRFRFMQVVTTVMMAFSHGQNDGQKSMGVIAMAIFAGSAVAASHGHGPAPHFEIPLWVMIGCAAAMGLGSGMGGWKIIKTIGRGVMDLEPIHGCVAQFSAAVIIMGASRFGAPISTTHTVSSTIMGVGISKSLRAVKWKVVGNIMLAWVLTMPASAGIAWVCVELLKSVTG